MQRGLEVLGVAAGEAFARDFLGDGELTVHREGSSRVRHIFTLGGRTVARLRWNGMRRAVYEAEGVELELSIGPFGRKVSLIANDGGESLLLERSHANPNRAAIRLEMAEGDNFCLTRREESHFRASSSYLLKREFHQTDLLVCRFDNRRRTKTTVNILIDPKMRWESKFMHRLLALITCRIIMDRRSIGTQPLKTKEPVTPPGKGSPRKNGPGGPGKWGAR